MLQNLYRVGAHMGKTEEREREKEIINKSLKKNDGAGLPHTHYFVLWSAAARPATAATATAAATTATFLRVGRFG